MGSRLPTLGWMWLVCCSVAAADVRSVQFVVLVPDAASVQTAQIFMPNARDGWKPDGLVLPRVAAGVYAAAFELEAGTAFQFKFTRDKGWGAVEKNADGGERDNREIEVRADLREQVVVCIVERWADRPADESRRVELNGRTPVARPPQPTSRPSTVTGEIRRHEVESPQLKNTRTVLVWLPPGYDADTDRRYPVLYMNDGQNVFDAATSYIGVEWQADETAKRLIQSGEIEPLIIVGIYNTPDRMAEYAPVRDPARGLGGKADAYLAFIAETLKPMIDKTYRTQPEREHTGIAGSSLAGFFSIYAICDRPEVFGKADVVSPGPWSIGDAMSLYIRTHPPRPDARIWVEYGTAEGGDSTYADRVRELVELLASKGLERGKSIESFEDAGAAHNEEAWAKRLPKALKFLYPARKP